MSRHHPPAYLRYLKARLWNLARPSFWGTAIFLSVVGLVIKEYWTNPDFFTQWQTNQVADNKLPNSSVSKEDRTSAAEIDNLPIPYNTDSRQANSLAAKTLASRQKAQAQNSQALLDALNSKSQTSTSDSKLKLSVNEGDSTPVIKLENPFIAQAQNLLQQKNFQNSPNSQGVNALAATFAQQNSGQNSFGLGTGLATQTNSNQNTFSESALQTALNQLKNQNQSNLNSSTSTQINPFDSSSQLSTQNRSAQTLVPSTPLNQNTINPLNVGTSSTPSGAISGTSYIQPGVTTGLQNPIGSTSYPQPSFNNLQPQNLSGPTSYTPPGISNPVTSYPQPQSAPVGIPQTPSAVPNRSAVTLNEILRNGSNNINSTQPQPPSVVSPSSNTLTPNQGGVNYSTPLTPNNFGNSSVQQAPAPVPQYIYSSPSQNPGSYTGGNRNRY